MDESQLRRIFQGKYRKKDKAQKPIPSFQDTTFEQFKAWFKQEEYDKECFYCGTTHERSLELAKLRPHAIHGDKLAQRLELDRQDPFEPYDTLQNLRWCCYQCNNAKSNFFTAEEFILIGKTIGETLKKNRCPADDRIIR